MINETMIPMALVPLSFLFVLLIILIVKAPKAGACVVSGLVLLAPLFFWRLAATGALRHDEAIPLVLLPISFLFVLLVILLAKAPKAGAALIVALVIIGVVGAVGLLTASHRAVTATVSLETNQWAESDAEKAARIRETERVFQESLEASSRRIVAPGPSPEPPLPPAAGLSPPLPLVAPSPIWSEGVEQEFEADVYPSRLAAIQGIGRRADRSVRELIPDGNAPVQITLFQEASDPALIAGLRDAVHEAIPQATCVVEAYLRNLRPNEIGVTMQFSGMQTQPDPWAANAENRIIDGTVHVHIFTLGARVTPQKRFVEMPWVENFATFASTRPERHFIVTRSREACTSESEARQQALEDARARLTEALGMHRRGRVGRFPLPAITTTDVLQGGFIVDQFAQSFNGTAGKIWRQAMLIDVSGTRLSQLADLKSRQLDAQKMSWGRMGLSALGVVVLIGAIYFFLNLATMGYYEWSLRIAGVILAIVAVIGILMVVR